MTEDEHGEDEEGRGDGRAEHEYEEKRRNKEVIDK